jgi:tetratricopeptide (TPR) repeat protein
MTIETEGTQPSGPDPEKEARPTEAPTKAEKKAEKKKDPVAQVLLITILLVIALALVTWVFIIYAGVLGTGAPRTMTESKAMAGAAKLKAGNKEPEVWTNYISALVDQKQFRQAQEWIDKGKKVLEKQEATQDMGRMQATLLLAQGNQDAALKQADVSIAAIKKANSEAIANSKKSGQPSALAYLAENENYWDLLLLKADIYTQRSDWKNALAAYNDYLAGKTTAATVMVQRAAVKEKLGDTKGAIADYKQALAFIPDNAEALAGLKRMGA